MNGRTVTEERLRQFRGALADEEKSPSTIGKYLRDLRAFSRYAQGAEVTKELAVRYKNRLLERYAPTSVNSMLAAVNLFFKWMGWYDCVVKTVKIQRQSFRPRERELTREEYWRLVRTADRQGKERLSLILQTLCATGIRIGELPYITAEAVNRGRADVRLKGKIRTVLLPGALVRALKRYMRRKSIRSGSVFVTRTGKPVDRSNIIHEMKALSEAAGVERKKVFPHNLRHLFACLYYKADRDMSRLADVLGHTSINTTRIYLSVSAEEQRHRLEGLKLAGIQNATA